MNPYVSPVNHGQFKNPICAKIYDVMYKFMGDDTNGLDVDFEEVNSSYNEVRCYVGQQTSPNCNYFHMLLEVESRNYYTQSAVLTVAFIKRGLYVPNLPSMPPIVNRGNGIMSSERYYDFNVMMVVTERVPEPGYFSMEQFMGEDIESVGCKNDNILNRTVEDFMYEFENTRMTLESCYVPNIKCENVLYEPLRVWAIQQLIRRKYGRYGTRTTF